MRSPIMAVAALMLVPASARAEAPSFEADVRAASGQVKEGLETVRTPKSVPITAPADPRCRPEDPKGPKLFSSDVRWGLSMPEMMQLYAKLYDSPKRLPRRAYWNAEKSRFELPHDAGLGGPVVVPGILVKALARHIERAFEKDYIDAVFFPDMGHSHLLIPDAWWKSQYDAYPTEKRSQMYTDMFSDPKVHIFYHTAEQLKVLKDDKTLIDDERLKWRHKTRNIGGPITEDAELTVYQQPDSPANTARDFPGFKYWGAGFAFSAHKDGCFAFSRDGKAVRFDISLDDLAPDPSQPVSDW